MQVWPPKKNKLIINQNGHCAKSQQNYLKVISSGVCLSTLGGPKATNFTQPLKKKATSWTPLPWGGGSMVLRLERMFLRHCALRWKRDVFFLPHFLPRKNPKSLLKMGFFGRFWRPKNFSCICVCICICRKIFSCICDGNWEKKFHWLAASGPPSGAHYLQNYSTPEGPWRRCAMVTTFDTFFFFIAGRENGPGMSVTTILSIFGHILSHAL